MDMLAQPDLFKLNKIKQNNTPGAFGNYNDFVAR